MADRSQTAEEYDFAADKQLFETPHLPPGPWTLENPSRRHARVVFVLDNIVREVAELDTRWLDPKERNAVGAFIVAARTGYPAAVKEIETLCGVIRDMQQDSTAYRQGYADGENDGWNRGVAEALIRIQMHCNLWAVVPEELKEAEQLVTELLSQGKPSSNALLVQNDNLRAEVAKLTQERDQLEAESKDLRDEITRLRRENDQLMDLT